MNNAELIKALRCKSNDINDCTMCAYHNACYGGMLAEIAADALEAAEKRIAYLEENLMCGINGYRMKDLILFAELCKRNDVKEEDMKQAAWNLELAVRAVMNERQEIVKNAMDEITMRFTPDFKKAYEEMMPNCGAKMKGDQK